MLSESGAEAHVLDAFLPGGVVTFADMLELSTNNFGRALVGFVQLEDYLKSTCAKDGKHVVSSEVTLTLAQAKLLALVREAEKAGLADIATRSMRTVRRIENARHEFNNGELLAEVRQIRESLFSSLKNIRAVRVPLDKVKYLDAVGLFGADVAAKFPSAQDHIIAAGECLALDHNTATVYHLMCVMERGMDAMAKDLRIVREYKTWKDKIEKMAEKVTDFLLMDYGASPLKGKMDFYKIALERLTAVQHATRNEAMHARSWYTEEEAEDVFRSVKGFMRQLASKLKTVTL